MRYVKQRNGFSCVPVALINVAKWVGEGWTYRKHYDQAVEWTGCDRTGANGKGFQRALKRLNCKSVGLRMINNADISLVLGDGGIVVVASKWMHKGSPECHLLLVVGEKGNKFQVINGHESDGQELASSRWMTKKEFADWYLRTNGMFPFAWVVGKVKDTSAS